MAIPLASTPAAMRLDEMLEVPLKIIPLEDLMLERCSSASQPGSQKIPIGGNRLCHSADSPTTSSSKGNLRESQIHPDKTKSFSSPCLFDCCTTPSQWRKPGPYSNLSKFTSAAITLPNGSTAVIPIMVDYNEETLSDIEMQQRESDTEEKAEEIRSRSTHVAERTVVTAARPLGSYPNVERPIISTIRNGESGRSSSSSSLSSQSIATVPIVLGKVTENPTRYEDLLMGQGRSGESNNNNSKSSDRNIIRNGELNHSGEDRGTSRGSTPREDNTLKLTFYNDGRKQSEKEYQTSANANPNPAAIVGNDSSGVSKPTYDPSYYENHHGLQLSRVLRGMAPEKDPTPPQRHGDTNGDNTQASTRPPTSSPSSTSHNNGKAWEQWEGLQISRCQKDSQEKVQNANGDSGSCNHRSDEGTPSKSNNSQSRSQENDKGESETLIDRHIHAVVPSMRYVRTAPATGAGSTSGQGNAERSITAGEATAVGDPARPNPATSRPLVQAEVARGGGIVRVSHQVRSSPSRHASPGGYGPSNGGCKVINKVTTVPHSSPSTYQGNHVRAAEAIASSSSSWPERTIARIPTRPYLLKNNTYELQRNPPTNQISHHFGQQQGLPPSTPAPTSLHSTPKRYKPALPVQPPAVRPQHQQPHQPHGFIPNVSRYSSISPNVTVPTVGHTGNGISDRYHHNSVQHPQQHVANTNSLSSGRGSIMSYGNVQQSNAYSALAYGTSKSPSHGINNISPPYRSPVMTAEPIRNVQNYSNNHHSLPESLLAAAAFAAKASSPDPVDQAEYYERIRLYYEIYQNQNRLDLSKLAEYYQKFPLQAWDSPGGQNDQFNRQSVRYSHPQAEGGIGQVHGQDAANMAQHQRALRAMEVAGSRIPVVATVNRGATPFQLHPTPVAGIHGRTTKVGEISPPQISPSALQNLQNKYAHNPHHLQQLRQIHERQYQNQIHQQQQLRYQASLQQQHHQQQPTHGYPTHYAQQPQQSPSQSKTQQAVPGIPPNYDVHNTSQYRSAYQLAAAAEAVVSANASVTNHQRPSVIDIVQNHLSTTLNNLNNRANAVITPAPAPQQDLRYHPSLSPRVNQHQQSATASISSIRSNPTNHIQAARSTTPPIKEVPYMPNIHRHTLEQAIKNNFKTIGNETPSPAQRSIPSGGNIVLNPKYITITPSPPPPPQPLPPNQAQSQNSGEWPKEVSVNEEGSIVEIRPNMNRDREPLQIAASPTLAHQRLVIRRVQQPQQLSPVNSVVRKTPVIAQSPNSARIQIQPIVDNRSAQQHSSNQRINYSNNIHPGNGGVGVLKRRINIGRPDFDSLYRVPSPIPLIVGEKEIITANVSPSAVLTTINQSIDGAEGEIIERHANENGQEPGQDNRPRSRPNSRDDEGNQWQYDHVVLLDKRTMTYMCKRCFETLKTEQEIRNHLFCKMLAGHVRCHVCFQLLKSEQYPEHLQVHGVRPPEEEEEEEESRIRGN